MMSGALNVRYVGFTNHKALEKVMILAAIMTKRLKQEYYALVT